MDSMHGDTTIDTHEAIRMFHELMNPQSSLRVLSIVGTAKMGKSHLLTRVFPSIAHHCYQARSSILDLRNRMHTVSDLLYSASCQLDTKQFGAFYAAYDRWLCRPQVEVHQLLAAFSHITISGKQYRDKSCATDRLLTAPFVDDLGKHIQPLVVLIFDSLDCADQGILLWLMEMFLISTCQYDHVRVILGGRSLLEAHPSYRHLYSSYALKPVEDLQAYIEYCHVLNVSLGEQSIRDFAHACDYQPGLFVDFVVPKFLPQRILHGSSTIRRTSVNEGSS